MPKAKHAYTTRRVLLGGVSGLPGLMSYAATAAVSQSDLADLNGQFSKLEADYQRADITSRQLFTKTYPLGREAKIKELAVPDGDLLQTLCGLERRSGFEASCEALDDIFNTLSDLSDRIMGISFNSPATLALKARACLWEAPAALLEREGFGRVATFLSQLAPLTTSWMDTSL